MTYKPSLTYPVFNRDEPVRKPKSRPVPAPVASPLPPPVLPPPTVDPPTAHEPPTVASPPPPDTPVHVPKASPTTDDFYPPPSPPNSRPATNKTTSSSVLGIAIGATAAALVLFSVLLCVGWIYTKRRRFRKLQSTMPEGPTITVDRYNEEGSSNNGVTSIKVHTSYTNAEVIHHEQPKPSFKHVYGVSICTFEYEELVKATNNFSKENYIGEGGFGFVHKGVLPNSKKVAIKQLKLDTWQGEREFETEIEVISCINHKNLVSLVGYCISEEKRLLVYEFLPNKTLEYHLHDQNQKGMDWETRLRIALGSAKGLAYLHEDCCRKVIHRDIKASNILLDDKFEPKVSDFGLAKFSYDHNTHLSTRVMGSFGYLAPEYAATGNLTEKSDVYSFGVVLLELITGRCPSGGPKSDMEDGLADWARPLICNAVELGVYGELVDPSLLNYDTDKMRRMIVCAASCIRHSAKHRPPMSQIVRVLEGDVSLDDLNRGLKLGYSALYTLNEKPDGGLSQRIFDRNHATNCTSESTAESGQSSSFSTSEVVIASNRNPR